MLFQDRAIPASGLARRISELMPEYLPGMDTGAAEPFDSRICWNKTLKQLLTVIGKERGLTVEIDPVPYPPREEQLDLFWKHGDAISFAAISGWGDRNSLERRLQHLESIKAGQKLLLYSCKKWQDAVLQQIHAALLRYTDHIAGEQYLFLNLLGPEASLHLHVVDIAKDGSLEYQPNLLRPLEGSPFHWRTR